MKHITKDQFVGILKDADDLQPVGMEMLSDSLVDVIARNSGEPFADVVCVLSDAVDAAVDGISELGGLVRGEQVHVL